MKYLVLLFIWILLQLITLNNELANDGYLKIGFPFVFYTDFNGIGLSRKFNKFKYAIDFFQNQELSGIGFEKYKTNFYLRGVGSFKNLDDALNARRKFVWETKNKEWNKYFPHLITYSKFLSS